MSRAYCLGRKSERRAGLRGPNCGLRGGVSITLNPGFSVSENLERDTNEGGMLPPVSLQDLGALSGQVE